ncbi:hypothetical protein [Pseudomonas sp. TWI929]|uniref:hypothetical protein n=1 Tax=Pseudomonas sp. TWI929 TaxID=3136795 RepID=UPI003209B1C4
MLGYKAAIEYIEALKGVENDPDFGEWLKQLYQQLISSSKANVIDRQTYIVSFSKKMTVSLTGSVIAKKIKATALSLMKRNL